ncbi:tautomerase [Asanoa ishikariensis]|uniref:Phenylpyruvate tautomerase PptA, 4-oxalocrotonate tautomerase family n=1 Tax=Asanoa ishikariensis TaxID=137265 RepID=A0A1H3UMZ4_9ACTN|nr:tautomerase family protein [Asanoa ishikariensis]GIF69016.1 tautomerase [Asanoa ishikariensis]SDZ63748.1 Phenylpyruvate tautomerase PptA, 4-oxalocrotonate tautomerase family [Asanoa ishikariensis]
MPIYTCTTAEGTLTNDAKASLAAEISKIHSAINHVPPDYVNVVFTELPTDNVYVGSEPGTPVLISGWARRGHPQPDVTRLALEVSKAAATITHKSEKQVLVVIDDSPARSAVEHGSVLPEPGDEANWQRRQHPA